MKRIKLVLAVALVMVAILLAVGGPVAARPSDNNGLCGLPAFSSCHPDSGRHRGGGQGQGGGETIHSDNGNHNATGGGRFK